MGIQVLDCTLRDGGYINDWQFSDTQIQNIVTSLQEASIDVIECGYLNEVKGAKKDTTLFDSLQSAEMFCKNLHSDIQKVVMINLGDYDIANLQPKNSCSIDGIRLAFHKKDLQEALDAAKKIVSFGYKLYFQPMITKNYTDLEFLSMIEQVNKIGIYAFYIVDSFGSMTLKEFQRYMVLADHNLDDLIALGYHSHNNMQLAFSNAISMSQSHLNREIIIDASIYGIGRGAGNLNTELITDYLNTTFKKRYNTLPLLEIIDSFLSSLMKQKPWGFSPAQYLSALYNCHPNYATYLINKNTNHIVGIRKVIEKLPDEKKSSYDKDFIEKLYQESLLEMKTSLLPWSLPRNKKVLLIASGKSVQEYQDMILQKVNDDDYITIALNHKPSFECDYYFFSNPKRFDEFYAQLPASKIVITSNIDTKNRNVSAVIDIRPLVFVEDKFITNVAIVMINYLYQNGFLRVEIVGLDGYKLHSDNYNYKETSVVLDTAALQEENQFLRDALIRLEKKIDIEILTPSVFTKDQKLKIIGVIPARYKSSRFEGKPLCLIKDIPMIKRTYTQASKSKLLDKLVVATDSLKIQEYCQSQNIPVVMTSESCLTGTDRIAEVAQSEFFDLYVNIQGDEPVIDPSSIDEVVAEFKCYGQEYIAYNLYKKIDQTDEIASPTIIKVITNEKDELMYMSRLGIPFNKSDKHAVYKKQVCVYGFTKKALELFASRDKTLNEQYEDIEILRFLDMGYKVKMKETTVDSIAVDVVEDIQKVEAFLDKKGLE